MKKLTLFLLLAACGDNLHPAPDARFDYTDIAPPEPEGVKPGDPAPADACTVGLGECLMTGEIVDGVCDAVAKPAQPETCNLKDDDCDGLTDEGLTCECDDAHIDLNGHTHKCTHDQDLPSTP